MAKIVKKRKKLKLEGLAVTLLCIASVFSIASSLFLRTYNNSLSAKTQSVDRQISALQSENEALKVQVQSLSTRDRVMDIAQADGMVQNQNNVVTVAVAGE